MRQRILSIVVLVIVSVTTRASDVGVYIGKTRAELIDLYAPVRGVERSDRLVFNADIGGVHCVISYSFVRGNAITAFCTINNKGLTDQREALSRWSKVVKALLVDRTATDVQLKIDGVLVIGEDRIPAEPTVIEITGAWDEKFEFHAAFSGPSSKTTVRTEQFTMILFITPKDKTPPTDPIPLTNSELK